MAGAIARTAYPALDAPLPRGSDNIRLSVARHSASPAHGSYFGGGAPLSGDSRTPPAGTLRYWQLSTHCRHKAASAELHYSTNANNVGGEAEARGEGKGRKVEVMPVVLIRFALVFISLILLGKIATASRRRVLKTSFGTVRSESSPRAFRAWIAAGYVVCALLFIGGFALDAWLPLLSWGHL